MISNFKVADPSPLIANKLLELISNQLFVNNLTVKASETGDNGTIRQQIIKLEALIENQRHELGLS
jgi:hypothetical protein